MLGALRLESSGRPEHREKCRRPVEPGLAHLEVAGGVLFVVLAYPVRMHPQGYLVVAASDLVVRGLAPHAQHSVKVTGTKHFLTQLQ